MRLGGRGSCRAGRHFPKRLGGSLALPDTPRLPKTVLLETPPMTKKLDLVFINPSSRTQVYQSLGTKLAAIENPVWAGLMATFCRQKGLSVAIIDAEAEELIADEVAE